MYCPPVYLRGKRAQAFFRLLACAVLLALTMCRAQAQTNSISGVISLEGLDNSAPAQTINFEFTPTSASAGTAPFILSAALTPPSDTTHPTGSYTLNSVPVGNYTVGIKGYKWLRGTVSVNLGASPLANVDAYLIAGDANNDNYVDSTDFGILIGAFGGDAATPGSGYVAGADFNCDGFVDSTDFGLLIGEFGSVGSVYQIGLSASSAPVTLTSLSPGAVTLSWSLLNSSGTPIPTPAGSTFKLYRSTTGAYPGGVYQTLSLNNITQNPSAPYNTYVDTSPQVGTYYYQLIEISPDGYAISNQAQITIVANPLIENLGGDVYRITGFQANSAKKTYQALVTKGLLNSYLVYDAAGQNGREFFHQDTSSTSPYYPLQFAEANNIGFVSPLSNTLDHQFASSNPTGSFGITSSFTGASGNTTIQYDAAQTGLTMTLRPTYSYLNLAMQIGSSMNGSYQRTEHVLAAQPKTEDPKTIYRIPGNGVMYALPLVSAYSSDANNRVTVSGVSNLRYYLDNGAALDAQFINPYQGLYTNYSAVNHNTTGYLFSDSAQITEWGRHFVSGYADSYLIRVAFNAVASGNAVANTTAPPLPFHVISGAGNAASPFLASNTYNPAPGVGMGMFPKSLKLDATNNPVPDPMLNSNQINVRVAFDQRATATINTIRNNPQTPPQSFTLKFSATDFWNKSVFFGADSSGTPISTGSVTVPFSSLNLMSSASFYYADLNLPMPSNPGYAATDIRHWRDGWFHLKTWIDQGDSTAATKYIADEDDLEFGVYDYDYNAPYSYTNPTVLHTPYLYNASPLYNYVGADVTPGALQTLGLRTGRIAAVYNGNSSFTSLQIKAESQSGFNSDFDLFNLFANPLQPMQIYKPDPNAGVLFVSEIIDDTHVYSRTQALAQDYVNPAEISYSWLLNPFPLTTTTVSANPITAWSISNEPGGNPNTWVKNQLYPAWQALTDTYTNPANGPLTVIGPNLRFLEKPLDITTNTQNVNRLGWMQAWLDDSDTFFSQATGKSVTYNSGADFVNGIGIHAYSNGRSWEEHGIPGDIEYFQKMITNKGVTNKSMWVTEHGWNWDVDRQSQASQAQYVVRSFGIGAAFGIAPEHNYYFYANENGGFLSVDLKSVLNVNLSPNRGGMAHRNFAKQTQSLQTYADLLAPFKKASNHYEGAKYVHAVAFKNSANVTVMVWGDDFLDASMTPAPSINTYGYTTKDKAALTFTLPYGDAKIFDIMGDAILQDFPADAPATYTIPATASPVYVQMSAADYAYLSDPNNHAIGGWPVQMANETNWAASSKGGIVNVYDTTASEQTTPLSVEKNNPLPTPDLHGGYNYQSVMYPDTTSTTVIAGDRSVINDGFWNYDDGHTASFLNYLTGVTYDVRDKITNQPVNYLPWYSALDFFPKPTATANTPVYVAAEIDFASAHYIDNVVVVCASQADGVASADGNAPDYGGNIRDYDIEVLPPGSNAAWTKVKSVNGNTSEWVLHAHLDSVVAATAIRIVVRDVNNGSWYEDKAPLPRSSPRPGTSSYFSYQTALHAAIFEIEAYGY